MWYDFLDDCRKDFVWVTQKREQFLISGMSSTHIFNTLNLIYNTLSKDHKNHIAVKQSKSELNNPTAIIRIVSQQKCAEVSQAFVAKYLGFRMVVFIAEIERRDDLTGEYKADFGSILKQFTTKHKFNKKHELRNRNTG